MLTFYWILVILISIGTFAVTIYSLRDLPLVKYTGKWITVFVFLAGFGYVFYQRGYLPAKQSSADQDETPRNMVMEQLNESDLRIFWETNKPVVQAIRYIDDLRIWKIAVNVDNASTPTIAHEVIVSELKPGIKYTFQIISGTRIFDVYEGSPMEYILE